MEWEVQVEARRRILVRYINVDEVVSPLIRSGVISASEEAWLRAAPSYEEAQLAGTLANEETKLHVTVCKQEIFVNLLLRKTHVGVLIIIEVFRQVGHTVMANILQQMLITAISKVTGELCVSVV